MNFYESKLDVVIDRNLTQTLKRFRSVLEELFDNNSHLNTDNVNLVNIEEKKKRLIPSLESPSLDFQIFK